MGLINLYSIGLAAVGAAARTHSWDREMPASAIMPRLFRAAAVVAFTVATMAPVLAEDAPSAAGKPVGDALYGASFKDLKDQTVSMSRFKGKVLVMYYWATWCVPCRLETPNLVKLNEKYKDKGVVVVGLALDNGDKVRDFVKDNNVTYPIFYGGHDAVQLGKTMGNDGGAIPFTVVIDKDGKLVHTFKGDLPNEDLEKIINPLVG